MFGAMWRTRGLALASTGCAALAGLAAPAGAMTLTAHTNRGGTCHIPTIASRSGTQISYGVNVRDCSTRFGIRYVVSLGVLYDQTDQVPFPDGYLDRKKGGLPYTNRRTVSGTSATDPYRTRIDVSVVLRGRRNARTRHPERWRDPGKGCRVKTTNRNGDTLGCELGDTLPAG
jgi:hypothetical protein